MILQQRRIRKGGSIMRCAPNQVGTLGVSTLNEIWHQKGYTAHHWKVSEVKPSNASEDCSIISATPPPWGVHYLWWKSQQGSRMHVLEDGEGERGLFWSQRRMNRKKITSTLPPTYTHTHTHTQSISYLVFSCWAVLNLPLPTFCHPCREEFHVHQRGDIKQRNWFQTPSLNWV